MIIAICSLLLIAYLFDLSSSKTRIPSVILLLLLGWVVRQITQLLKIQLPDFSPILPALGTVGLILIVLEGSLELELNKSKLGLISKSFFGAFFPLLVIAALLAWLFNYFGHFSIKDSLLNAIPFAVISSSIAIPSVKSLPTAPKEFVIYESSLSDIVGVLFFNFMVFNEHVDSRSFAHFGLELAVMIAISFVASILLAVLLSKIEHHIKFVPITLLVILIYTVAKIYHLPALLFILLFGLFIGNLDEMKHIKWIKRFKPAELNKEVQKFKELTVEGAFLVRALFFLLFGYLLETGEILNTATLGWSIGIVAIILVLRVIQLKLSKLPLVPLAFIAPRGLITILLFLSIPAARQISLVNKSLIIQVIVLTALAMMVGLLLTGNKEEDTSIPAIDQQTALPEDEMVRDGGTI
ncbi:MAG: cation:proton antiporter [Bacteroidota bacterium]